jgi:cell division protein FtsW (lipid II flippase)
VTHTWSETQTPIDESQLRTTPYDEELKRFNWSVILLMVIIFAIGIFNLISATSVADKSLGLYRTQLIWFGLGAALTAIILLFHYSLFSRVAYIIYFTNLILLE